MSDTNTAPPPNGRRRRGLTLLAIVVVVAGLGWGAYWFLVLRGLESTDDAYVDGDVVQVTSEVPGTVLALHADDTQAVARGDLLVELDPADAKAAMAAAEAGLASAVRQVRGLYAHADALKATIAERSAALARSEADLKRRLAVAGAGAVSTEEIAHGRDDVTVATAALEAAKRQLDETEAAVAGTELRGNPLVLAAEARLRETALALRRTRIVAPVAGVVAKRSVQLGQRVAPGTPLLAVVPLGDLWVNANFKEVQLRHMRVGQAVTLTADLYGGGTVYHGRVAGLAAGTGSAFALLPAQNATGNWIKIVQRVPVRILLDPAELRAQPLRVGLSVDVEVDISDQSGPPVATRLRNEPLGAGTSDGDDPAVAAEIDRIVAANAGGQ
jgi:membrane fusion protein (multidrug efflux system)